MNKKQVVKAEITYRYGKKEEMYGIAINDSQVLLENEQVCDIGKQTIGGAIKELYWGDGYKRPEQEKAEIKVSATRNVPSEIRKALEMGLVNYLELYKQLDVLEKTLDTMKLLRKGLHEMNNDCRAARGVLTKQEFAMAFEQSLSFDAASYGYRVETWGNDISIQREVDIEKWYREENEIVYEEYDGTMQMRSGAEDTKTYKDYIRRNTSPLPVKSKLCEQLTLADKDWLVYQGWYDITLDTKRPLTKEYAKELADKFCGVKTRAKGKDRE